MKLLLHIEWLKLKNYTAFKVISILYIIGIFLSNYIVLATSNSIKRDMKDMSRMAGFTPYQFDHTWQTTSYVSGCILIIPALLLIILFTNEYTYKTTRQNIIDGLSRIQFLSTKIALALIFALVATLLTATAALIFGFASGTSFSTENISQLGCFFLKACSYNMFAILISVLIKKTGFAIGLCFIYLGGENLVSQVLDVWSMKLRTAKGFDYGYLGDYLPMNAADGLLKFPKNNITSMAKTVMPTEYVYVVLTLAVVYLILFAFFSIWRFQKADL